MVSSNEYDPQLDLDNALIKLFKIEEIWKNRKLIFDSMMFLVKCMDSNLPRIELPSNAVDMVTKIMRNFAQLVN